MNATDLHHLLAEPAQAGVYFVDVRDRAALSAAGCVLGFAMASIDLRECRTKSDALQRFARAWRFPDWFGNNWDALGDALGDLSWLPAPGYLLLLDHAQDWREAAPADFEMMLEVVAEAAARWAADGVAFWALLPLPTAVLAASNTQNGSDP